MMTSLDLQRGLNVRSFEKARVLHARWRRGGGMAARSPCAAAGAGAADRCADGFAESDAESQAYVAAFRKGLQKLGWTEGRNIRIDFRWTALDAEATQRFAKELVALKPDLILSHSTPTTTALLQQTRTIPIIFANVGDPVGSGFVASFPRPGGNVRRFQRFGAYAGWQVGGTAQGDCAACCQGRDAVQPGSGDICQTLAEPLQSRRPILRSGGDRSTRSRQIRAAICASGDILRIVASRSCGGVVDFVMGYSHQLERWKGQRARD
jgi:hypothetical protein